MVLAIRRADPFTEYWISGRSIQKSLSRAATLLKSLASSPSSSSSSQHPLPPASQVWERLPQLRPQASERRLSCLRRCRWRRALGPHTSPSRRTYYIWYEYHEYVDRGCCIVCCRARQDPVCPKTGPSQAWMTRPRVLLNVVVSTESTSSIIGSHSVPVRSKPQGITLRASA